MTSWSTVSWSLGWATKFDCLRPTIAAFPLGLRKKKQLEISTMNQSSRTMCMVFSKNHSFAPKIWGSPIYSMGSLWKMLITVPMNHPKNHGFPKKSSIRAWLVLPQSSRFPHLEWLMVSTPLKRTSINQPSQIGDIKKCLQPPAKLQFAVPAFTTVHHLKHGFPSLVGSPP